MNKLFLNKIFLNKIFLNKLFLNKISLNKLFPKKLFLNKILLNKFSLNKLFLNKMFLNQFLGKGVRYFSGHIFDFHDLRTFVAIVEIYTLFRGMKSGFRQLFCFSDDKKGKCPRSTRSKMSIPKKTRLIQYMMPVPKPDPAREFLAIPDPYPTKVENPSAHDCLFLHLMEPASTLLDSAVQGNSKLLTLKVVFL